MSIYLRLTTEFNEGRVRAIISSGQAVVLHRLAIMSKDGDWIIREDIEATSHILAVLQRRGAAYRFGAPLDVRWLAAGWSSHAEFNEDGLRVRTDFFSRPPRIDEHRLAALWTVSEKAAIPFVPATELADIKKTKRLKDFAVIGELARIMLEAHDQLLYSRSARDLLRLAEEHPELIERLSQKRPVLLLVGQGRDALELGLLAEQQQLMREDEQRLAAYARAAEPWRARWSELQTKLKGLPIVEAHKILVGEAERLLPREGIQ